MTSDSDELRVSFSSGSISSTATPRSRSTSRFYRLVDQKGEQHPVLDGLYDSLDAAWSEALTWWSNEIGPAQGPVGIGVEVSTASGSWRTLRYPGS